MASTTFVNYQTVIDAGWLNDVNSAVYSGTFQASTITPTNVTSSGAISGATVAGTTSVTTPIVKSGTSLSLQTNGSTTAVTIDTAQNVGVGVTPSAWNSGFKAIELGKVGNALSTVVSNGNFFISQNAYYGTSGFVYSSTAAVSYYNLGGGAHYWFTAPSGTAGTGVSATQAMTLDNSGNLLVGVTSATGVGGTTIAPKYTLWNTADTSLTVAYFQYNSSTVGSISRTTTTTSYNITSDRRLKTNIVDFTDSGKYIDGFKPRTFIWISNNSQDIGFITDEYQQTLPSAITGEANATKEEEYEITPAVKDEQGNITTPAVMGTRTVPVYQQGDFSTSAKMAIIIAELQSTRKRLSALEAKVGV